MSIKQQIMEKLFAEKPLSNEEILYIGSNLNEESANNLPYDHNEKNSLSKACGLIKSDFEKINSVIKTEVVNMKKELNCNSKLVEVYEKIGKISPQNFRLLMFQFVRMKDALEKKQTPTPSRGDDFKGFLDSLR